MLDGIQDAVRNRIRLNTIASIHIVKGVFALLLEDIIFSRRCDRWLLLLRIHFPAQKEPIGKRLHPLWVVLRWSQCFTKLGCGFLPNLCRAASQIGRSAIFGGIHNHLWGNSMYTTILKIDDFDIVDVAIA